MKGDENGTRRDVVEMAEIVGIGILFENVVLCSRRLA
jgi:hypothetical protein